MAGIGRYALRAAVAAVLTTTFSARGDGLTPEEAKARMVLPPGFRAEVFASEPDIRQPVASCFDERGRLWVIEYLQYPNPAGLKPVTVDQYLRTEYDRVPEPPPRGPRGADRIKILEDTDGDGKADKVKTFVEGLNLASAIAVGHGGVWVGQAPYLLFYPDRDRDDRPDGDPEVVLSGFGLQDAHATVNSMMWGPDGRLYGAQGSTVTARIRGAEFQQGIWRYDVRTKQFELFAEGGGNTWGLDFNRDGDAFGSSNGTFVAFHMVQGGWYWKGFAKHGPLHNPRSYGYFDAIPYDGPKQGGHVTPGGIIYKGDNFPPEFQGTFIGGNLLANTVYWHLLKPDGSSFRGRHGGTLIDSKDPWFRPIDLITGPDGAVYVVDWYDKRASHLDPRDNWDRSNGRIYKITYGRPTPVPRFDLAEWDSQRLLALRDHRNDWWPDMARRILGERRDRTLVPDLKRLVREDEDQSTALRDLWALNVCGGLDDSTALEFLAHKLPGVRRWTIRLMGDEGRMNPESLSKLLEIAEKDSSASVRNQLACSAQRWKPDASLPILGRLIARSEDVSDPMIPMLLWWSYEKQMRTNPSEVVQALSTSEVQRLPIVRDVLLERLARALASDGAFDACAGLIASAPGKPELDRIVHGMEKGLEGRGAPKVPPRLATSLARVFDRTDLDTRRIRFGVRLNNSAALDEAIARAEDSKRPDADRQALIEVLGQVESPRSLAALLGLLGRASSPAIKAAALNALGGYDRMEVASAVVHVYPGLDAPSREKARALLGSRKTWATALLHAMASGKIPPSELKPTQAQQIAQHGDPKLTTLLEKVWGRAPGPGSDRMKGRIAEIRGVLPEGDKGSPARGAAVFKNACGVCHKLFGDGETIGPELTGSERGNLDFLLQSIVDPSALIRKEYQAQTVALTDGRILNGLILDENDKTLTVIDSQRQKTVVPRSEVDAIKPSEVSVMPEGLMDKLPPDQIRDLFRYLQSPGPVSSP